MPIALFKSIANSDGINIVKSFSENVTKAETLKTSWDEEIESKKEEVNNLKDALEKYETAYNFVGLFQGFDELSKEKNLRDQDQVPGPMGPISWISAR